MKKSVCWIPDSGKIMSHNLKDERGLAFWKCQARIQDTARKEGGGMSTLLQFHISTLTVYK